MDRSFWKYQALGNTYAVVNYAPKTPEHAKQLCSAEYGLGTDGLLIGTPLSPTRYALKIINPDGSEAEKSGNGLRIFVRHLIETGAITAEPIEIQTLGGVTHARFDPEIGLISVNMGHPNFFDPALPQLLESPLDIEGRLLHMSVVSMGNPHCVVHSPLSAEEVLEWGPKIERHRLFPNRTNVQFLDIRNRDEIAIQIWERGAGYTLASGSSACAAAAVAFKLGRVDTPLTVQMPGGRLFIEAHSDGTLVQTGPAEPICYGELAHAPDP